jgi:hypothetical protein
MQRMFISNTTRRLRTLWIKRMALFIDLKKSNFVDEDSKALREGGLYYFKHSSVDSREQTLLVAVDRHAAESQAVPLRRAAVAGSAPASGANAAAETSRIAVVGALVTALTWRRAVNVADAAAAAVAVAHDRLTSCRCRWGKSGRTRRKGKSTRRR